MRTTKASMATPMARPKAMGFRLISPSGTKAANTDTMMMAAAVTTLALPRNPEVTEARARPVWT